MTIDVNNSLIGMANHIPSTPIRRGSNIKQGTKKKSPRNNT